MLRHLIRFCLAALILAWIAPPASCQEPVTVGLTLGLTGKYRQMSRMQQRGFLLWQEEVNARGGLLGRPVELLIADDGSHVETAVAAYEDFIKGGVEMLFAPYSSNITEAVAPLAEAAKYPMLASGASADSLWEHGYRYIFGVCTPASRYSLGFLEMLLIRDVKKIAVLAADDSFSKAVSAGTLEWAGKLGLEVVLSAALPENSEGFPAMATKAREAGGEALIVSGHFDEAVNMRRALAGIGWTPKAFYASVGPVLEAYQEELGPLADLTFSSTQWQYHEKILFPGCAEFNQAFLERFGVAPSYHAATAYAAGQIMEAAVKRAGGLDREAIRDALIGMDQMTIIGRFGVDRTGKQIRHFALIVQWQDGSKEVVWPPELATQEAIFP